MKNKKDAVEKAKDPKGLTAPVFISPDEMFEKFATLTREIADLAYDFSRARGGELGKEFDDWFRAENELLRPMPVELRETEDDIFVSAAVPGFKPEEIEISIKDDILMINGITETNLMTEGKTIVRELKSNRFCRLFTLPSPVVVDKVSAKLNNGMLELTLPKAVERDVPKVAVAKA